MKEVDLTKTLNRKILKFTFLIAILLVPFVSVIQSLGVATFLESFEHPEHYVYLKTNENYEIIQKSSHPDFNIESGDVLLYYNLDGELTYNKIDCINAIGGTDKYYISNSKGQPIFERQIVGKIIGEINNDLISSISIKFWDISIHNLNIRALVAN